jgi:hypothetical protein
MFMRHPGSAGIPPAAEVYRKHDAATVRLAHGVLEEFAPLRAHERRAAGHRRGLAGIKQQGAADALLAHFFKVAGDAFLAGVAIQPPPVTPRLRFVGRRNKLLLQRNKFGAADGSSGHAQRSDPTNGR